MIEVWIDKGEAFFCEGGRIQLHISSGTVSKNAIKFAEYNTNSMTDAHKLFSVQLESAANEQLDLDGAPAEGWD